MATTPTHQLLLMDIFPILLIRIEQGPVPSVHQKQVALSVPLPIDPKPIRQFWIGDVGVHRAPSWVRFP